MTSYKFYIPLEYNFYRNTVSHPNHKIPNHQICEKCYANVIETLPNHTYESLYLYRYKKLNVNAIRNMRKRIHTNYIITTDKKDMNRLTITFMKNFDLYHWLTILGKYVNIHTDLLKIDIILVGQRNGNENGIYRITKNVGDMHNIIFFNMDKQIILPLIESITFN